MNYSRGGTKFYFKRKMKQIGKIGVIDDAKSNEITVISDGVKKRVHRNCIQRFFEDVDEKSEEKEEEAAESENVPNNNENRPLTRSCSKVKFNEIENESFYAHKGDPKDEGIFLEMRMKQAQEENYHIYMANVDENEEETPIDIYVVEIPTRQHFREDVKAAKLKEIKNLENYDVFAKVDDNGQEAINARWVVTEKEKHDGQKVNLLL